jgi:hypothetical protein
MDLRKYNVIVIPSASGADVYTRMLGESGIKSLKGWVEAGGTLIAMGGASAFLADSTTAFSQVRQRRQVLGKLTAYDDALAWLDAAGSPADSLELWEVEPQVEKSGEQKHPEPDLESLQNKDALAIRLRPRGTIMAANLDEEHWLAFGERSPVPLLVSTTHAYLAQTNVQRPAWLADGTRSRMHGVQVPARYAAGDKIRLSGLLWPEARERWSRTVAVSRETFGKGQIILFASQPNFRAYFHGGERLLLNAILLGPGFGTRATLEW